MFQHLTLLDKFVNQLWYIVVSVHFKTDLLESIYIVASFWVLKLTKIATFKLDLCFTRCKFRTVIGYLRNRGCNIFTFI